MSLIGVECVLQDDQSAQMKVSVEDTGVGIPAEKRGLLFEKFSQVDGTTTRKYGGTGLGLAISKQLVDLMGGAIGVDSREHEGSTFWFTLPLTLDGDPPPAPAPVSDLRGLRVLIVDDNEVNRRVLHEQIAAGGCATEATRRARRRIAALLEAQRAGDPYHFVLLDYQMPSMDGAAVAAAIRANPAFRDTVVLMLTSIGHMSEVRSLEGAKVDACLVKPVRQSQLLNAITTAWSKRVEGGAASRAAAAPVDCRSPINGKFAGSGVRVLIAEDNVVNQKVAAKMLERLGLRADVAANGREAVDMLRVAALRPYSDGLPHARDGRVRRHRRDPPPPAPQPAGADHRHDRRGDGGLSRGVHESRDGRLHRQAGEDGRSAGSAPPLDPTNLKHQSWRSASDGSIRPERRAGR